ncbi:ATP-grasp domain-containing protein [Nannocystis pusilla]|uniref:ATP-grasp domain-containing protein n=1 Tax=Nannocystis pusilla TaxID=889268 RepID=UPI003B78D3CC
MAPLRRYDDPRAARAGGRGAAQPVSLPRPGDRADARSLRHHRVAATDVPIAREYRVFLYRGEPLAHGYYWPYFHDFVALSPAEEAEVLALARRAAARLDAPLLSLDIAQLESGAWIVIEPGDPQFSGLSFIAPRPLWRRLAERLSLETGS